MSEELKPCPFCGGKAALRMSWMEDGHRYRAVECVECGATTPGNYSEVGDQSVWDWNTRTPEQVIAATLGKQKAKAHPYGYELDTGAFDVTRCECGCLNDISATYCNDCGGEIEIDMNAEKEIYHTPRHLVFAEKHDDGSLEFGGKRYIAVTLGSGTLTAEQVREAVLENFEETHETYYDHWEPSRFDWQAIADELNAALGGGECEMEYATEGMKRGWWVCSECGEASDTIKACGGRVPPNFCANCGAKAVKR